jgi:hypothetical protein
MTCTESVERVAEFGFAPKFQGYEPRELLLLYPAMLILYTLFVFWQL